MGVAATGKALVGRWFSFTVFGWSQILIDLEPLVRLTQGAAVLHGHSHTYLGALFIAPVAVVTGKTLCQWGLRLWNEAMPFDWLRMPTHIGWRVAAVSAAVGTFSHVLLDSIQHHDVRPWWPLHDGNALLGVMSYDGVYTLCLVLGGLGALGVLARAVFKRLKNLVEMAEDI